MLCQPQAQTQSSQPTTRTRQREDACLAQLHSEYVWFPNRHGQVLMGRLFRPQNREITPAVVLAPDPNGCSGFYDLAVPYARWVSRLTDSGYTVLVVDSWRSRHLPPGGTVAVDLRRADLLGATHYLNVRRDVDNRFIAAMGWGCGADTVIATAPQPGQFRAAVAFFPEEEQRPASDGPEWPLLCFSYCSWQNVVAEQYPQRVDGVQEGIVMQEPAGRHLMEDLALQHLQHFKQVALGN